MLSWINILGTLCNWQHIVCSMWVHWSLNSIGESVTVRESKSVCTDRAIMSV
uniref:Transmembrane protein n=1 Tax=Medicago truncatula TaxID=3880 RepID=I3SKU1_MEDTR|nr:unknown [Medicago truncatula]